MAAKLFLVTGGTGFIGSALTRRLVREGLRVRVMDNQLRGAWRRIADVRDQIELIEGDIRDPEAVMQAVRGVDAVCHLAFVNGTRFFYEKPGLVLDVGVKGIVNVLDACAAHSVPEFFFASSSEVYQAPPRIPTPEDVPLSVPDPANPRYSYAAGKILGEMMTLHYAKDLRRAVIFRPHNVYGPDMGWEHVIPELVLRAKKLADASPGAIRLPIQGRGDETRAFIFIDDFIEGLRRIIERGEHRRIYHIGSDEERSIGDVARAIGRLMGRPIELELREAAAGSVARRCPDISRLRALGYRPSVTFEEGLLRTARWYLENAGSAPKEVRS